MSLKPLPNPKKLSYGGLKLQVRELARRMNLLTMMEAKTIESTGAPKFVFSEELARLDVPSVADVVASLAELKGDCIDELARASARIAALEAQIAALEDAVVDASGTVLQYQVSHIGDERDTSALPGRDFVWDFFNRYLFVMSTTGNTFTTITQVTIYSYYAYSHIVAGTPYPPSSTGITVSFRAQKLDGTWVAGVGSGNWGIGFMQATTVGAYVPIQAKLTSGNYGNVVIDTEWFDIGGYTFMGVVGGLNVLNYASNGFVSRDERDAV